MKPSTALLILLDRIKAAGCPVDDLFCQLLYAASVAEDADRSTLPFILDQEGSGKPPNLDQVIGESSKIAGRRECLQYLFEVSHCQMELCRSVEEKIKVPTREGLRILKFMLSIAREMRNTQSAQGS